MRPELGAENNHRSFGRRGHHSLLDVTVHAGTPTASYVFRGRIVRGRQQGQTLALARDTQGHRQLIATFVSDLYVHSITSCQEHLPATCLIDPVIVSCSPTAKREQEPTSTRTCSSSTRDPQLPPTTANLQVPAGDCCHHASGFTLQVLRTTRSSMHYYGDVTVHAGTPAASYLFRGRVVLGRRQDPRTRQQYEQPACCMSATSSTRRERIKISRW